MFSEASAKEEVPPLREVVGYAGFQARLSTLEYLTPYLC